MGNRKKENCTKSAQIEQIRTFRDKIKMELIINKNTIFFWTFGAKTKGIGTSDTCFYVYFLCLSPLFFFESIFSQPSMASLIEYNTR